MLNNHLLYDFFIYQKSPLTYRRIKDFLDQFVERDLQINTFYTLFTNGVIDSNKNKSYELTQTTILKGTVYDYAVNLNFEYKEKISQFILAEDAGALILKKGYPVEPILNDEVQSFHFKSIVNTWTPLENIFGDNTTIDGEEIKKTKISFNPFLNKFSDTYNSKIDKQLHKIIYSKNFYKYQLHLDNKVFTFHRNDFELVAACKLLLQIDFPGKIVYNKNEKIIHLKYISVPKYIIKLLRINHCLQKGYFPSDSSYYIDNLDLDYLNRKYFKNKLHINYE